MISAATSIHFTPHCKYCGVVLWECCPANQQCQYYGINFCLSCYGEHEEDFK